MKVYDDDTTVMSVASTTDFCTAYDNDVLQEEYAAISKSHAALNLCFCILFKNQWNQNAQTFGDKQKPTESMVIATFGSPSFLSSFGQVGSLLGMMPEDQRHFLSTGVIVEVHCWICCHVKTLSQQLPPKDAARPHG